MKTQVSVENFVCNIIGDELLLKGQMNQKIDIFSFIALPSPNTKKNHPK